MKSTSSFSLGETQLDEQSSMNELDVESAISTLGHFSSKDKYFHKNRSKHHNDPAIVKKLREKLPAKLKEKIMTGVIFKNKS